MEEERCYTVYMHVCKENGKVYIGITSVNPNDRWKNGFGYYEQYFGKAIKKYGWDNFEHIILFENKTKEEAECLEILYIKILLSSNRTYGYNVQNGGNSVGKHSEETIQKLSEANKGLINPNATKVFCNGETFGCIKDCAKRFDIEYDTMVSWLEGRVITPKHFLDMNLRYLDKETNLKTENKVGKQVICDGKIFKTIKDCADIYHISRREMNRWLLTNKMPQKFINLGLRYADTDNDTIAHIIPLGQNSLKGKNNHNSKKVICNNDVFDCVKDCADFYAINYSTMRSWLQNKCNMRKEFKDLGLAYYTEN